MAGMRSHGGPKYFEKLEYFENIPNQLWRSLIGNKTCNFLAKSHLFTFTWSKHVAVKKIISFTKYPQQSKTRPVSAYLAGHLHISAVIRTRRTITDQNSHLQPGLGQGGLNLGLIKYNHRGLVIKHVQLPPGEAWDHLLLHVSCHGRTLTGPGNINTKSSISATTEKTRPTSSYGRGHPSTCIHLYSPSVVVRETKSDKLAALKPNFSL